MPFVDRRRALWLSALMLVACKSKLDGEDSSDQFGDSEGYTCPMEVATHGECPAIEETCDHGDFRCTCVCACDDPNWSGPGGFWDCAYVRSNPMELSEASITIDCDAGTIAGAGSFALDNIDGHAAIEVSLNDYPYTLWLDASGLPQATCAPCDNGCEAPTATVAAGATGSMDWSFKPTTCPQTPQLCDYCGGTATLVTYQQLASDGLATSGTVAFTNIPVMCP